MPPRLLLSLLLLLAAGLAAAQDSGYVAIEERFSAEQRRAAGLDTLTREQLAALNALLRAESEQVARNEAAAGAAAAAANAPAAPARTASAEPDRFVGMSDAPIQARIEGSVSGWAVGDEFRLDNGQVWKVLKGEMRLRAPLANPRIRIVPGVAGRWFLEVDPDLPKARVYRVD